MGSFKGLIRPFKGLRGLYKALKGLRPLKALISPFKSHCLSLNPFCRLAVSCWQTCMMMMMDVGLPIRARHNSIQTSKHIGWLVNTNWLAHKQVRKKRPSDVSRAPSVRLPPGSTSGCHASSSTKDNACVYRFRPMLRHVASHSVNWLHVWA